MSDDPFENLNERQTKFVQNYVAGMTQQEAYLEAGYEAEEGPSAKSAASQLANKDKVKKAIAEMDKKSMTEPNRKLGEIQISNHVQSAIDTLQKINNGEFDSAKEARVMKESATEILDRAGIMPKKAQTEEGQLNFNFDMSESQAREIEAEFADVEDDG